MRYQWDQEKAATNLRKHGIAFEDAILALQDPDRLEWIDDRFSYGEVRQQILGRSHATVLFVVTTERGEDCYRIISARKATRDERRHYRNRNDPSW